MKIIFAGTPEFAVPALQMLIASKHQICAVYTQPDRPSGRGRKIKPGPVKSLAVMTGLAVYQPDSFNIEATLQQLAEFKADLMIVVAFGMILPQSILDIPRLGCVNIHGSLLPRWRGAAPIHRAILAGDKKTGVTIMQVEQQLDAGDMLHKEECFIGEQETASQLHDRMAELGAVGLRKVLALIEQGKIEAEKQDESLVTYAEKIEKNEADLDWSLPAAELSKKVRAFNAWPIAQTKYQGKVLRIWCAEVVIGNDVTVEKAGYVLSSSSKYLDVATGEGILRLLEVQLPGGKRMPATAFLNAHNVAGLKLG